jgi:hypothetical protein
MQNPNLLQEDGPSNDDRASWAEAALLAFGKRTRLLKKCVGDKEDPFFIISDLLTDLAHWCDRHNLEFSAALVHAAEHYGAETNVQGTQFGS